MERERRDYKKISRYGRSFGWDPLKQAKDCIENFKGSIQKCDASGAIAYTGCIFGNVEAAFYEGQINEEEMEKIKSTARDLRIDFVHNCKCVKR